MKKILVTILLLCLAAGGFFFCRYYFGTISSGTSRVSSDSEDAVYVEAVSNIIGYGSSVAESYDGIAEAQQTIKIELDSDRTLDECFVKEGDEVEEGQALFSYQTQDEEDDLEQAKIDIEKYQMEIEGKEASIESQEKLMAGYTDEDEKSEAYLEILSLQNEIKTLEYDIKKNELKIVSLEETIAESTVTAEIAGIVQSISDPEETSGYYSDDSAYMTILSAGDYRVKGTVNELNYGDIYEGMPVIVTSRADSSLVWTGMVTEISAEPDKSDDSSYSYYDSAETSTYSFYIDLNDSDGLLLGQHVIIEADISQNSEKDGLWLEEFYIIQEEGGYYVWLADTSNTITKHAVTVGDYDVDTARYEILDGLQEDDYIAFPSATISEGDPVSYYDTAEAVESAADQIYDMDEDYSGADGDDYYDADSDGYFDVESDYDADSDELL
ncbi:MAG: efflux RND transporter periplasmic adaptor subunit [Lachnospiraceae bacterium]|nr:efflux RND transporter periplasmic adaptor subunit [Lachnospiraceae bacterium]